MKTIKFNILLLLCFNVSLVFSQVKVIYKSNGAYKELEYKSYEECGCERWAVDFYKEGAAKPWGMSANSSRKALEAEISDDILSDYHTWKRTHSDHENYIIYCSDIQIDNNNKEVKETKVTSVDGVLVEEAPNESKAKDIELKKRMTEMFGRRFKRLLVAPVKYPGSIMIKFRGDAMGSRAEKNIPKAESMSITADTVKVKKTYTKK
jgi:hypothetical protein